MLMIHLKWKSFRQNIQVNQFLVPKESLIQRCLMKHSTKQKRPGMIVNTSAEINSHWALNLGPRYEITDSQSPHPTTTKSTKQIIKKPVDSIISCSATTKYEICSGVIDILDILYVTLLAKSVFPSSGMCKWQFYCYVLHLLLGCVYALNIYTPILHV